jgi:hypothetical protein
LGGDWKKTSKPLSFEESCTRLSVLADETEQQAAYMIALATAEANGAAANYLGAKLRASGLVDDDDTVILPGE